MTAARGRLLLGTALLLGVSGDLLFRADALGLNFAGWVALAVFAALLGAWEAPFGFDRTRRSRDLLVSLAVMFAAAAATTLRAAPTLVAYDVLAVLTAAAFAIWTARGRSLARTRVRDVVAAWRTAAVAGLTGAPLLALRDADPGATAGDRTLRAVVVGTFLAVPPVFVVGALLAQADPMFGDFLTSWRQVGVDRLLGHAALAGVIAWPAAGWLRGVVVPPVSPRRSTFAPPSRIDFVGLAPALYALVGLIAAYLGLQARALFGGAAYVEATSGLTYAEYARRGFFELVAVTAIVLVLLLAADWVLDRSGSAAVERYRRVGWVLLALLGVLMASALQRMWLYVSYYGLSDTRLYATAGMAWLAGAAAWFGGTVLRGRRARFGIGVLVLSAGWLAGLNLLDPERVVVQVNLGRALAGREFDVAYHAALSTDAVPALVEGAALLPAAECAELLRQLAMQGRSTGTDGIDWRTWTLSRSRAERALATDASCPSTAGPGTGS